MFLALLYSLLLAPIIAEPQDYHYPQSVRFQRLSTEDGLSQSAVKKVFQDSRGYLWFATGDGLNQYDGYRFKHFRPTGPGGRIAGNIVLDIAESSAGNLWVATTSGLTHLNTFNGNVRSFRHDPMNDNTLPDDYCEAVLVDSSDRVWVGTAQGVALYIPEQNRFRRIQRLDSERSYSPVRRLYEISDQIWLLDEEGLAGRYDEERHLFIPLAHEALKGKQLTACIADKESVWFGCVDNTIIRLNTINGQARIYSHPSPVNTRITSFTRDTIGRFWAASGDGTLRIYSPERDRFETLGEPQQSLLPEQLIQIRDIYTDRSGVVWIATDGYGLFSYSHFRNKFTLINNSRDARYRTRGNYVYGLIKSGRYLWMSTVQVGLERLDLQTGLSQVAALELPEKRKSFYRPKLYRDSRGFIWTLPGFSTAYRTDPESLSVTKYPLIRPAADMIELSSGEILVGYRDAPKLHLFTSLEHVFDQNHQEEKHLPFSDIYSVTEVRPEEIWIATSQGVIIWHRQINELKVLKSDPEKPGSLPDNQVHEIKTLKDGTIALATLGGLALSNGMSDTFTSVSVEDGLPNDVIYALEQDNQGLLWLSTNRGLVKFSLTEGMLEWYTLEDGLQSNEFNTLSSTRAENGQLFFGGINGVSAFYPEYLIKNNAPPTVAITSCSVMGKELSPVGTGNGEYWLKTTHDQNFFSFGFAVLDYNNPAQNRFRYRVRGIQDEFRNLGTEHTVNLELPPGEYTLEVTGANSDGVWSLTSAQMRLYVQPAFWQTPQAILLATVVLLGAAAIAISFGVRSSQKQQRRLNQQISEKTAALEKANQELEAFNYTVSHDLQSPLMNLSHYIQLLREIPEEGDRDHERILNKINEITHRMRRLVRDLLFFSRSSTATFSPQETNLYIVCLDVVNELQEEQSVSISLSGPQEIAVKADEGLLKIAIKNIIQNSLKFSPDPENLEIKLSAEKAGWGTIYRLADNGKSIDERFRQDIFKPFNRGEATQAQEGTGIGLAIVQRIIKRHGGSVWIEETPGGGTTVAFTLAEKAEVD